MFTIIINRGAAEEMLSFQAQLSRRLAAEMMVRQQVSASYHLVIIILSSSPFLTLITANHHQIITPLSLSNIVLPGGSSKHLALQSAPSSGLGHSQRTPLLPCSHHNHRSGGFYHYFYDPGGEDDDDGMS